MKKRVLLAMVAFVMAGGTQAAEQDGSSAADKPTEKPKLICKTDKMTGSLTRRTRTCKTAEQWDALTAATQKDVGNFVRDSLNAGNRMPASSPTGQ